MERGTWTDERVDEKMASIDRTFDMLRDELRGLREDNREQFSGLRSDFSGLRSDVTGLQDRLLQIGFGLVGVLLAAMVALIVALA